MRDLQSPLLPLPWQVYHTLVKNTKLTSIEIFFNATTKARDEAKPVCRRENIADLRAAITTCEIQILTDVMWGGGS